MAVTALAIAALLIAAASVGALAQCKPPAGELTKVCMYDCCFDGASCAPETLIPDGYGTDDSTPCVVPQPDYGTFVCYGAQSYFLTEEITVGGVENVTGYLIGALCGDPPNPTCVGWIVENGPACSMGGGETFSNGFNFVDRIAGWLEVWESLPSARANRPLAANAAMPERANADQGFADTFRRFGGSFASVKPVRPCEVACEQLGCHCECCGVPDSSNHTLCYPNHTPNVCPLKREI
jgi:hypothetical protein